MELKIEIRTVPGNALWTAAKLKPFILGFRKVKNKVWANKKDDTIYWIVECPDSNAYIRIGRNLAIFDKAVESIVNNRLFRWGAKVTPSQMVELRKMLENQTSVRVVKRGEAIDLSEFQQTADTF